MDERRRQVRRVSDTGQGVAFSIQGEAVQHNGLVNDISDGGIGLTADICVVPGTILEITIEEDEQETYLIGEVRWCAPDEWLEGTYHMGVATQIKLVT